MSNGAALLQRIMDAIVYPTMMVVFTLGLFLFFWGIVEYMMEIKDGKTNGNGRQHMLWGMVGMFIMVSAYGIIAMIVNTLGIDLGNPDLSRINDIQSGAQFR